MSKPVALKWVEALQAAGCLLGSGASVSRPVERSASLELSHGAYLVSHVIPSLADAVDSSSYVQREVETGWLDWSDWLPLFTCPENDSPDYD